MSCQNKQCIATANAYDDFRVNAKAIKRDNDKDSRQLRTQVTELTDNLAEAEGACADLMEVNDKALEEVERLKGWQGRCVELGSTVQKAQVKLKQAEADKEMLEALVRSYEVIGAIEHLVMVDDLKDKYEQAEADKEAMRKVVDAAEMTAEEHWTRKRQQAQGMTPRCGCILCEAYYALKAKEDTDDGK